MAFWKESMINRLSNLINRNRSAAKISQVLCSSLVALLGLVGLVAMVGLVFLIDLVALMGLFAMVSLVVNN